MLLKVKCDKCKTKYKLDDSRIQGKGAKITCPRCGNVFVVMKPPHDTTTAPVAARAAAPAREDVAETETVSMSKAPAEALKAMAGAAATAGTSSSTGASTPTTARTGPKVAPPSRPGPVGPSRRKTGDRSLAEVLKTTGPLAQIVKRPTNANELDWKAVGITTFKVKVGIGLVYDFSDVATLKKYIAENRVVETDRVSFDGKVWTVLKDINSIDEFFIDQWVALKLERLLEEEQEAQEAGLPSPISRLMAQSQEGAESEEAPVLGTQAGFKGVSAPTAARSAPTAAGKEPKPPEREAKASRVPEAVEASETGVPVAPPPPPPAEASPGGASPGTNGLSAKELFDDVPVGEEPVPAEVPVTVPASKVRPAAKRQQAPARSSVRKAARRSSQALARLFDVAVVLVLAVVAGYLGWRYYTEGQTLKGAVVEHADPTEGLDDLERLIAERFPVAYAAAVGKGVPSVPGPVEEQATPTPTPVKETPRAHQPKVSGTARAPARGSKGLKKPRGGTKGGKGSKVVVTNITAEDLYQVGVQALNINDYQMAIQSLESAVQMKPASAKYRYMLGYAYYRGGRYDEAVAAFRETLNLKRAPLATHKWLGDIYAGQGKKEAAIAAYKEYLKGSPRDADAIRKKIAKLTNS